MMVMLLLLLLLLLLHLRVVVVVVVVVEGRGVEEVCEVIMMGRGGGKSVRWCWVNAGHFLLWGGGSRVGWLVVVVVVVVE
jgi:hypothetical protein